MFCHVLTAYSVTEAELTYGNHHKGTQITLKNAALQPLRRGGDLCPF